MKIPRFTLLVRLLAVLFLSFGSTAWGIDDGDLLDPERAFRVEARMQGNTAIVRWEVAEGYYLYRDRIQFRSLTPGVTLDEPDLPEGKRKDDPIFGEVAVFRGTVEGRVGVEGRSGPFDLQVIHQGCADIGVCYPPNRKVLRLTLPEVPRPATGADPLQALGALVFLGAAQDEETEILDPEVAFRPQVHAEDGGAIQIRWEIEDGYYLYQNKLKFRILSPEGVSLGRAQLSEAKIKDDPTFGPTPVYFHEAIARIPVRRPAGGELAVTLEYEYQGCAEAGLCYPPEERRVELILPTLDAASAAAQAEPAVNLVANLQAPPAAEQDRITAALAGGSLWATLGWMFLAGLGLAFTACVYPMIPILSSLIVGQGTGTTPVKGFVLSLIYVEAVALTYAVLGVASGFAGAGIQAFFQHPVVLVIFALLFVGLALSMFGFFAIQLPAGLQGRLTELSNKQRGGNLIGVFLMGVLSALIVGPCAGPVMAGAALYVAQTQDWVLGGLAFFALGNGMGAPLLLVGASGGKLLPRAGIWMDTVKAVFGVILLAVAILMLERVLPGPVALALYALLFLVSGVYMGAFEPIPKGKSPWRKLWKGLGLAFVVWGVITLIGAAFGGRDVTNPLHRLMQVQAVGAEGASAHVEFTRIKSVQDLQAELEAARGRGQATMLDFYADWCTYCITLEDYVFPDPRVREALKGVRMIQADVTENDAADRALMNHFGLIAPPAILFFDQDGAEIPGSRVIGELDASTFAAHARHVLGN